MHSTWNFHFPLTCHLSQIPQILTWTSLVGGRGWWRRRYSNLYPQGHPMVLYTYYNFYCHVRFPGSRKEEVGKDEKKHLPAKLVPTQISANLSLAGTYSCGYIYLGGRLESGVFFFLVRKCLSRMKILFLQTKKGWLLGGQLAASAIYRHTERSWFSPKFLHLMILRPYRMNK